MTIRNPRVRCRSIAYRNRKSAYNVGIYNSGKEQTRMNIRIVRAERNDLQEILDLQYLAYQSEARLFGSQDIPPLKQTIENLMEEYEKGIVLKAVTEEDTIIGSVRAYADAATVYIGKLMVHPDYRHRGYGRKLLAEIENCYAGKRYELFTSTRSKDNLRLYQSAGYTVFDQKPVNEELVFVFLQKR